MNTDIARLSMNMSAVETRNSINFAMMDMVLETAENLSQDMVDDLAALSVTPSSGVEMPTIDLMV